MNLALVTRLAKQGKSHGLTLQWAQISLIERLARNEQQSGVLHNHNNHADTQ